MLCIKCQEAEENKESGFCDNCEKKEEGRINGLLYLPALGLIIGFFTMLYNDFCIVSLIANTYQKQGVVNGFSVLLLALSIINAPVTVLACWFFFRKKVKTRYVMITYYLYGLIFASFCTLYPALVFHVNITQSAINMLARALISCLIWVPYFIFSSRINKVFVH
ncbi:DUF2569 domain-containing protein [Pantoea agglomerans]|uniref:DUF2569 domain-containing protein n=1 Tax=Enterobacter agglomerans TaxID=549 RepID=UPI00045C38AC|nr:DUF2569 domain-containing protein [Pantoea agglomerans]KDA95510.1 hypothetical protein T296_04520 [Pantoea agglomerans Eh318]